MYYAYKRLSIFVGTWYHLNAGGDDFYIRLLFYNLNLTCD